MSVISKLSIKLLFVAAFEFFVYSKRLHQYIDSFFFVWTILFLGFFLFTLFNVDTSSLSLIAYKPTNPDIKSIKGIKGNGIENKKIIPSSVLTFLIMFILNLIGFLIYRR